MNRETDDIGQVNSQHTGMEHISSPFSQDAETFPVLWIDAARLSRECITNAVSTAEPRFIIHAVKSMGDAPGLPALNPALAVYYSHAEQTVDVQAIEALHATYPSARLVVLSDAETLNPAVVRHILLHNVAGFILTRRTGLQMVVSAISLVHSGGTFVPRDFLMMNEPPVFSPSARKMPDTGRFTQRELAVLDLIRLGQPNKQIADELGMSASTVKVHVRNIMQKMGVTNRTKVAMGAEEFLHDDRPDSL